MIWIIIDTALIVLALGGAAGTILLSVRMKERFEYNYLNTLMYYQILLFIFGLYGLLGTLFVRNILSGFDIPESFLKNIAEFIPYLGIPVIITAWFLFIKLSLEMVGKRVTSSWAMAYFGMVIIALLIYALLVFGIIGGEKFDSEVVISYSKYSFGGVFALSLLVVYLILFGAGIFVKHKLKRLMILKFASISLIMNLVTLVLLILHNYNPILEKAYMVIFFSGQFPAVAFLSYYLNKYFQEERNSSLEVFHKSIIDNYELSKREWEIVQQICEGHTNNQISENLFISLQTVKDHVSRIYKKTGVKNRVI